MITYQEEPYPKLVEELKVLLPLHYAEVAEDQDRIPLDPDWGEYMNMHCSGILHIFTAREGKELVGYHVNIVKKGLHYKSNLFAMTDIFYLKPELRGVGAGLKMFVFVHEELKKMGVEKIFTGYKVKHDLSKLFDGLGYRLSDKFYTKLL